MTGLVDWAKQVLRISSDPFIVGMLLAGAALLLVRPRWGRRWAIGLAIAYWFVSTPLGSGTLAAPLARGFHPIEDRREADQAEAIVVLGGGIREVNAGPTVLAYPTRGTALRTVEAVRVFRLLGGRPLIVASGGLPRTGQRVPEGEVIASDLEKLQVPRDHILVEALSHTTYEEAIIVTRLLQSRGIRRFVLVTSPTHMWRSVLVFRAQRADVVPSTSPAGSAEMAARRLFEPNEESLERSDAALYDYFATLYYWARGSFRLAPR